MLLAVKWDETSVLLPEGEWTNRLTGAVVDGGRVAMADLLQDFPVALLVRNNGSVQWQEYDRTIAAG